MAIHLKKVDLLKESLNELIYLAGYSIRYRKIDPAIWGSNATGGILGYPCTVILFSIIDCVGSVFSGNGGFQIEIDGKMRSINKTNEHIYILNSPYFNLNLSQVDLNNIYNNIRSTLTHNSLVPEGYYLRIGENETDPFIIHLNEGHRRLYLVNLVPLYNYAKRAVDKLISDIDNNFIDFEKTKISEIIEKRGVGTQKR